MKFVVALLGMWLSGVFIPKEQNMPALVTLLNVHTRWLRYGGDLKDSFVTDYMSLCEADRATVRAVVGAVWRGGKVERRV